MVRMSHSARKKALSEHSKLLSYVSIAGAIVGLPLLYFLFISTGNNDSANDSLITNSKEFLNNSSMSNGNGAIDLLKKGSAAYVLAMKQPFLVYGTAWKKENTATFVEQAVLAGFRFIDTACQPKHYNEPGVGEGWSKAAQKLNLDRKDFFIQTKFTSYDGQDPNNVPYDVDASLEDQVKESLAVSLKNLKTEYLDSLVMHSPEHTIEDTMRVYRTMEGFVEEGKVLRLGISNCYNFHTFSSIYDQAIVKPSVLQNRLYKESNFDTELRQFCKEKGIWYQSFWTLTANRAALARPDVKSWAERKSLTPQTLMYAFLMQLGYVTPLSGTTNEHHMKEDVAVMERLQSGEKIFETDEELEKFEHILGMRK